MEHAIDHRPSFAQLTVDLDPDETLIAWLAPKLSSRQRIGGDGGGFRMEF